jgi:uracil-DNA glycosylase
MKQEKLESLAQELVACRECPLREAAQAPVGWFGNYDSPIVFVGEGPGGVEDDYGCPLIGPSGQLLDKALWAAKMTRDRILTTNVIKCRPKGNARRILQKQISVHSVGLTRSWRYYSLKLWLLWAVLLYIILAIRICASPETVVNGLKQNMVLIV